MKQILLGILALMVWNIGAAYWYICRVKDLCMEPVAGEVEVAAIEEPNENIFIVEEPIEEVEEIPKAQPIRGLTVYFLFERQDVKNVSELELFTTDLVYYLRENPKKIVKLTGYTCNIGISRLNYDIGLERANTIKDYMVSRGISGEKIIIKSKGEFEPKASNWTREDRMQNRRVEIVVGEGD